MTHKLKKGFTLIEIVIVLAIAALIMVVVFLAVQGAQRSQRNQARKDLANRGAAKATEYRGNHNNTAPTGAQLTAAFTANDLNLPGIGTVSIGDTAATCSATGMPALTAYWYVPGAAGVPDRVFACLEQDATPYQTSQ